MKGCMNGRIPRIISLPFGYRISVVQCCNRDYDEECGSDSLACWMVDEGGGSGTIYLRKSRPVRKRRADLAHEMQHACCDWQIWVLSGTQSDVKD